MWTGAKVLRGVVRTSAFIAQEVLCHMGAPAVTFHVKRGKRTRWLQFGCRRVTRTPDRLGLTRDIPGSAKCGQIVDAPT